MISPMRCVVAILLSVGIAACGEEPDTSPDAVPAAVNPIKETSIAECGDRNGFARRLTRNADGARWESGWMGYFERDYTVCLTDSNRLEIRFEQCIVWGPRVSGMNSKQMMAECEIPPFRWQRGRQSLGLNEIVLAGIRIEEADARLQGSGLRVVFNCNDGLLGCERVHEGFNRKALFGVLCKDREACEESAEIIRKLVMGA